MFLFSEFPSELKNTDMRSSQRFDPDRRVEKQAFSPDNQQKVYNPDAKVEKESPEKLKSAYVDDIRSKSEHPETIDKGKTLSAEYHKCSPAEIREKREIFRQTKGELRNQWEKLHGISWPRYEKDVYDDNGNLIRRKGDRYDAHHIQPLELGGKNEASNITPLRADVHYDHKGIHSTNSPLSKLRDRLGGNS